MLEEHQNIRDHGILRVVRSQVYWLLKALLFTLILLEQTLGQTNTTYNLNELAPKMNTVKS
jgi:hypothetical protein